MRQNRAGALSSARVEQPFSKPQIAQRERDSCWFRLAFRCVSTVLIALCFSSFRSLPTRCVSLPFVLCQHAVLRSFVL